MESKLPIVTDFSKTLPSQMNYARPGFKDLEWYQENLPGLPETFFEQMKRLENGEFTKKDLRNMRKRFEKKSMQAAKGCKQVDKST